MREKVIAVIDDYASEANLTLEEALKRHRVEARAFRRVVAHDDEAKELYAAAWTIKGDLLADDSMRVAADETMDPARARNIIDIRKWLLGKRLPKAYGDKMTVEHEAGPNLAAVMSDMAERRRRVLAPLRHLDSVTDAQAIDVTHQITSDAPDCKSPQQPAKRRPVPNIYDDSDD